MQINGFQEIPDRYKTMKDHIRSINLRNIYSKFSYLYLSLYVNEKIMKDDKSQTQVSIGTFLYDFLKDFKFLTYHIIDSNTTTQKAINLSQLFDYVICVEGKCIIIEKVEKAMMDKIFDSLRKQNSSIIDSTIKEMKEMVIKEEITSFINYFRDEIRCNDFVKHTISPICCYLIRRFFYPSEFFVDKTFFNFRNAKSNDFDEQDIKARINNFLISQDKEEKELNFALLKKSLMNVYGDTFNDNNDDNNKENFTEKEFIVLRTISSSQTTLFYLVFHLKSQHIFMMKKIVFPENIKTKMQHEIDFCKNYSNRCMVPFYGFLVEGKRIVGFVYEFMSNGPLSSFISSSKNDVNDMFKLMTINRIFQGMDYLHSNTLMHRDLKPSNILLDHDFYPYISDFETIRHPDTLQSESTEITSDIGSQKYSSPEQKQNETMTVSYPTDIYSFGLIIYFIYEKKDALSNDYDFTKKEIKFPSIKKVSENIQNIYKQCVKLNQSERMKDDEIKSKIIEEINSSSYLLNNEKNFDKTSTIIQFICESIIIEKDDKKQRKKLYENIYEFHSIFWEKIKKGEIKDYNPNCKYFYDARSLNDIGDSYFYGDRVESDILKAKKFYELSAEKGNSNALVNLGNLYLVGEGVEQDYSKAMECYQKAEKLNNSSALVFLGNLYENGYGVPQNYHKAKEYYELAAEKNNSDALIKIGFLYFNGYGVERNSAKGIEYVELAAKENNSEAFLLLGDIYNSGTFTKHSYVKAKKYYELAAEFNSSEAFYNLGNLYENGLGVKKDYLKAKEYYELAAKNKFPEALNRLGYLYEYGFGVKQDYLKAREYYELSGKLNNTSALLNLSLLYRNGNGVEKNYTKAIEYLKLAAELNNLDALNILGIEYKEGEIVDKDYAKAEEYFKLAAKQNHPQAVLNLENLYSEKKMETDEYSKLLLDQYDADELNSLGDIYYFGNEGEQDYSKAKMYYELAAQKNDSEAFINLGNLYKYGYGVKQDYTKSREYFELAAEQFNSDAYCYLAEFYENGYGVDKDYLKAKKYYELASEEEDYDATNALGILYKFGLGVDKNYSKAMEYFEKGAKKNHPESLNNLGEIYEKGYCCAKDYLKAKKFYELSSDLGDSGAFLNLGNLYKNGLGVNKDLNKAKECYESAAELNDSEAFFELGNLYENGLGVEEDYEKARYYYELSAKSNNSDAYLKLGNFYYNGFGVEKDYKKSLEYYELSAQIDNAEALFYLGYFYSTGDIYEINIPKAIQCLKKCSEIQSGNITTNKNTAIKYVFNHYLYRSINDLGLIYLTVLNDIEKGNEFLKESALAEYPFAQNNFGLMCQLYFNKKEDAEYMYERSSKSGFALAYFNLGNLHEKNGKIENSIDFYIKAVNEEDHPLMFHGIEHHDKRLNISKTFIICYTNLKLAEYYFSLGKYDESKKYFVKSFSKLEVNSNELSYAFKFNFQNNNNSKNIFSYLKYFILNFPYFNLINQPNLDLNIKKELSIQPNITNSIEICHSNNEAEFKFNFEIDSLIQKSINIKSNNQEKENEIKQIEKISETEGNEKINENKFIFDNAGKLFDFVIDNSEIKDMLVLEIKEIIETMNKVLFKPPYEILFGRIHIEKIKQAQTENHEIRNINDSFYEGFDDTSQT